MIKNIKWQKSLAIIVGSLSSSIILPSAANAAPDAETAYIFNTFSFLIHGFLVALMAAGFCMLEGGLVRAKNATVQSTKNISLYAIAGLMYAIVGYNLMYMDVNGYIGSFSFWIHSAFELLRGAYTFSNCSM